TGAPRHPRRDPQLAATRHRQRAASGLVGAVRQPGQAGAGGRQLGVRRHFPHAILCTVCWYQRGQRAGGQAGRDGVGTGRREVAAVAYCEGV
ncbi:hypothetical protein LTR33_010143, partial [Friedmanniomyces endolithicus]